MHGIRNTITDPAIGPRTPGPHTKDPGADKWGQRAFEVRVDGELFLRTDYPADCKKVIDSAKSRGKKAVVTYVGPERRSGTR